MRYAWLGLLFVSSSGVAFAADKIESLSVDSATRFAPALGWVSLSDDSGKGVQAVSVALGFVYGFNARLGLEGYVEQAFAPSAGLASVYSLIEVGGTYALLGAIRLSRNLVLLGGVPVLETETKVSHSLRFSLLANQYFLNGTERVVGLAGFAGMLTYEYLWSPRLGLGLSVRKSIASNGVTTISPNQIRLSALIAL